MYTYAYAFIYTYVNNYLLGTVNLFIYKEKFYLQASVAF